ncbi:MAG: anti-sigma factor family protein [Candidatus Eiseniibacteriota bacterium]
MALNQLHPSREDLFAYRDGELKPDRRTVIEAHVLGCHVCKELIDEVSALEADLRSRAEAPGEGYFERLTDQVMTRIQTGEAAPQGERRRSEAEMEWEAKRARAPRIPWLALISTASAAATVLVIAGLLIRQGAVLKNPPKASVLERSAPDAASRAKRDSLGAQGGDKDAAGKKRANREIVSKEVRAQGDEKAARQEPSKQEASANLTHQPPAIGKASSSAGPEENKAKTSGNIIDQGLFKSTPTDQQQKPADQSQKDALGMAAPSARAPVAADESAAGADLKTPADPRFAAFLERYGLPPTWGPGVSDESVLRSEAALRNLYRTGGIGSPVDSARARIYMAEAARARESAPDSTTVEEIIHHYQRAIRLSGGDAEVRRIAAQRLQDFLSERAEPR